MASHLSSVRLKHDIAEHSRHLGAFLRHNVSNASSADNQYARHG
jgi:hypothetical protein